MPNIVIIHTDTETVIAADSTPITYVTSAATVTDVDDTHISVTVGGVPIITMDINDITSIDGAAPYGNAGDIVGQITNAASGTPTLSQVLTAGASAGAKITNLTDPTEDQDAATKKYVDDNAGGLPYLLYQALAKQPALSATSGQLVVGAEYTIDTYVSGDDFANVADVQSGTINTTGCVFIATGVSPTVWDNSSVLESDGVPIPYVMANTLGGVPVWSRASEGVYRATLADAFPVYETIINNAAPYDGNATVYFPLSDGSAIVGYYSLTADYVNDKIELTTYGADFSLTEWSTLLGAGSIYINAYVYE